MKMHASAFYRCERRCSGVNPWLSEPKRSRSDAPLTFKCMPDREITPGVSARPSM